MQVQRVVMASGAASSTVVSDGLVIEPVEQFLAHLSAIERSPNTVQAYAHDLSDFFTYLQIRDLEWAAVRLEDLGRFVAWLRLPGEAPLAGWCRCRGWRALCPLRRSTASYRRWLRSTTSTLATASMSPGC